MATTNANVTAIQKESVLTNFPALMLAGEDTLLNRILRNGGLGSTPVSKRAVRVPLQLSLPGKFRMGSFDGSALGRGSSINSVPGFASTKSFIHAVESTSDAYWATDSQGKSIKSLASIEAAQEVDAFKQGLDALLFAYNGALAVVTVVASTVITVANANQFYDGQDILFYPSIGGTVRSATASTIAYVDANNKQIILTAAAPAGTAAGDLIMPDGSPGTSGASLTSIYDYHTTTNSGTYLTLNRATYPGKMNASGYAPSAALSPAIVRIGMQLARRKVGTKNKAMLNSLVWVGGVEQATAWENAGTAISQIFRNIPLGKNMFDPLAGDTPDTMAGREFITQLHGDPTRIDSLMLKNWGTVETKALGPYKVPGSGQSQFAIASITDGSPTTNNAHYIVWEGEIINVAPSFETAITTLTVPAGL
jgi:hypothetical protein